MVRKTASGVLLVAAVLSAGGISFARESTVFEETADAYYTVQLDSVSTYEYEYTYKIYFKGSAETATIRVGINDEGRPIMKRRKIASLVGLDLQRVALAACVGDRCVDLSSRPGGDYEVVGRDNHVELQIKRPESDTPKGDIRRQIASGKAAFRLAAGQGMATLVKEPGGPGVPSEVIAISLPALGQTESQFLGAIPSLRFRVAPLVRDESADDENGAALAFEGGVYRFRRSHRLGATYSGNIATEDELSFGNLKLDLDYERNLSKKGYIPFSISAGGESDQHFDVINGLVGVRLQYILPFNINASPRDGYIPNTGPLFEVKGELGWNVEDDPMSGLDAPDDFQRLGYSFRWMVPVGRDTVMRLHHAGSWVLVDEGGADEFRKLWEVTVETKLGNVTYFVGYQSGEAAPLYFPIETTRTGIVYKFE